MDQKEVREVLKDKGFTFQHITDCGWEVWTLKGYWYHVNEHHVIMVKPVLGMVTFSYERMEPDQLRKVLLS